MTDEVGLLLAAVDQVPFILAVCEGPELRVLSLSGATRAVLPGREFLGRPIREVISDLIGQQFVEAYYEVYRTGEPVIGQEWRAHLARPDGSVHEMYANFSITPWTVDGVRRGVVGVGIDVTETVRQRQAAAEEAASLRRRYDQSRDVITALQLQLLPAGLPVLPGAQVAASYLLADADTGAGGDWFDAVAQRDGRVALTVGDVVGHGVPASGVMGQLRAVLFDRLDDGAGLPEVLGAADRFAARVPAAHATTLCVALLDPATGDLEYCTAGHPPPLIIGADGSTRYLAGTGGAPLGTGGSFPIRADRLGAGDLLLLYSDGILERPGRDHAAAAAELAQVAADSAAGRALHDPGATPAERVCTQTVELLVRATGHRDDITLLAVQRVPVLPPLVLELPADPGVLSGTRRAVDGWLRAAGAPDEAVFVMQHALGELITNAIEHGFAAAAPSPAAVPVGSALPASAAAPGGQSGPPASPSTAPPAAPSTAPPAAPSTAPPAAPSTAPPASPSASPPVAAGPSRGLPVVPGRAPTVSVRVVLGVDGTLEATVADHGCWREPERQPVRGRGLALTAQLVDFLRVEPGPAGTVARVRHSLVRPARLLDVPPPAVRTARVAEFRVIEQPGGDETRVRLVGALDATTAAPARQELLRRSRGGTVAMTIDLSGVTLLSSAGVSALHEVAERHTGQKTTLSLYAAAGSPAQVVLELVALPYAVA